MEWIEIARIVLELFGLVGIPAVAATMTPNSSSNRRTDLLWRGINACGMNLGKARNR
jgi:hypothetical protein